MNKYSHYVVINTNNEIIAENTHKSGDQGEITNALRDIVETLDGDCTKPFEYHVSQLSDTIVLERLKQLAKRFSIAYVLSADLQYDLKNKLSSIIYDYNNPVTLPEQIELKLLEKSLEDQLEFVELSERGILLFGSKLNEIKSIKIWFT